MSTACPLCRARKGKRACPAKGEKICPACCGSKRRVAIDCPDDCVYLTGAHAPAWEGRETERRRDARRLASYVKALDEPQVKLLFFTLAGLNQLRARHRSLDDHLLHSALDAFVRTLETREKGVLFEHTPDDLRAGAVLHDLSGLFETTTEDGQPVAPRDHDLLTVLTAVRAALHDTQREQDGPTAFLDTVARLADRLGVPASRPHAQPLIIEP